MDTETRFLLVFVVATAVAIIARRVRVPYTVALVLAGLVLGALHLFEPPHLTKQLLFAVFLPGLLFEAAFHVNFRDFWRDRLAIAALAVPGVAAAIALTAVILEHLLQALDLGTGFGWHHAVVFGAIIAATDPIAVVSVLKSLGAPRRLSMLLEGESLLNDGTAIVFFALVLDKVSGWDITPAALTLEFVRVVGGGLAVGVLIWLAIAQIIRQIDDAMIEITLTTLAAYGSFLAATQFGFSGVIATVAAGMVCGNYAARSMSPSTHIAADTFWEYLAFALNSFVFLLVGMRVHVAQLVHSWAMILAAYGAVTLARAGVVFAVTGLNRAERARNWPLSWSAVLTWGGLRGGVCMVLALGLPLDLTQRDVIITATFGVVVLSILLQGLTMGPLLRHLGLIGAPEERRAYQLKQAELRMTQAALSEIERLERHRSATPKVLKELRHEYEERAEDVAAAVEELQAKQQDLVAEEATRARRQVLLAQKDEILADYHRGTLTAEAYSKLLAEIDARLADLDGGQTPRPGRVEADDHTRPAAGDAGADHAERR
ncbi:MAG: Na+/H+ antiporter [Gemmatimonadales bacterium]